MICVELIEKMPAINTVALGNHPIQIPSDFPGILKQYTKAAIRTQPRDLLLWSAAYFRCLARGEPPPAKDRLEYPVPQTDTGKNMTSLTGLFKTVWLSFCSLQSSKGISRLISVD